MHSPTLADRLLARDYPSHLKAIMNQQWRHLLFLHWEYDPIVIQKTLPKGLFVDTFENKAYIGIVPFWMEGIKPKFFPMLHSLSQFFELNCRTYVYDQTGTPGVWFYSLNANQYLAVQLARQFFHLPYRYASTQSTINSQKQVEYRCQLQDPKTEMEFIYKGEGNPFIAEPSTLDFFLIERYILFANKENSLVKGQVHHSPYVLSHAQVTKWDSQLFEVEGFINPNRSPDLIHFSSGVDVEIFNLQN